jgi:peptidoglycan hydrolase-like protein with peptidoglycan-binding domain
MAQYKADIAAKRKCCDCVGLIKGYYWAKDDGTQVYGLDGRLDKGADGMFSVAKVKGKISTLPEIPGLLLYSPGHVGVYVGGGYTVEARGFNYGVVKTKVSQRSWSYWYQCPYIDYLTEESPTQPEAPNANEQRLLSYASSQTMIRGNDVKQLQEMLLQLGYTPGKADGIYGPSTKAAVVTFQKKNGLEADGRVEADTWAALEKAVKAPLPEDAEPEAPVENGEIHPPEETGNDDKEAQPKDATLDFGDRLLKYQPGKQLMTGADVRAVQSRLHQLGHDPGAIDGEYGPMTATAISAFQATAGIHVDGIVGPITRSKLAR